MRRSLQTTDDPESNGDLLSAGLSAQSTESLSSIADTREVGDFAEPAVAHRHDAIGEFHDAEVVGDHDGGASTSNTAGPLIRARAVPTR